uniref:Uncharacterized protein n=1 Tax=Ananas comosus var. bracteatus TaxID=296719 RepID=A0A6V7QVK9_ANACO
MCYVGKATKIFFFVVGVLAVGGLVLGFGLARHSWAHKARPCQSPNCRPIYSDPIPAVTGPDPDPSAAAAADAAAPNPTSSAAASTTSPFSVSAAPQPFQTFGPPSPASVALGPAHA